MAFDYEGNKDKLLSSSGQRLTVQLFEELAREDVASKPIFKLSDWRRQYVTIADPTGYKAAMELLGDWEHWLLLTKAPAFAAALKEWNEEVDHKLRSEAIEQLRKQSRLPTGTAAAKVLAGLEGKTKKVPRNQVQDEMEKETRRRVGEDAERLGIRRVK